MIKAVIIDDVAKAIKTLKQDLDAYCPDVEIIGEADGVVSGAKLLKNLKPELVFLDIQMQDGSGFDLLEIVPEKNFKVIFTTASDAFAIKAFRYAAVDYLLKPVDPDELMEAVAKIKDHQETQEERLSVLSNTIKEGNLPQSIALHTLEKIHIVKIANITRCESSGNYTQFFFTDRPKLLVTKTLKEFDKLLQEHQFIRVHQSHLVNAHHIKEFVKLDGGYLIMTDGTKVAVSVRKRGDLVNWLSN
ncbi:MAG: LytR/AlgR family response regulator transcription factor [Saprospiraceae bacterium]